MNVSIIIFLFLCIPFLLSFLISYISYFFKFNIKFLSFIFSLIIFLLVLYIFLCFENNTIIYYSFPWLSYLNINFSIYLDYFSIFMCLLSSFISLLIFLYSCFYLVEKNNKYLYKYYHFLFLFLGSIFGVFASDNLIQFFLFWELTSISSFFLIGLNHNDEISIYSSKKSLFITCGFGIIMIVGFLLLCYLFDTYNLLYISQNNDIINTIWNHKILFYIFILILFGIYSKSAQGPFYIWLPNAMVAPTPISSFLHSSTMVKVGIYLIYRIFILYSTLSYWFSFIFIIGLITILYSSIFALYEYDLKGILAYSTIGQIGYLFIISSFSTNLFPFYCLSSMIYFLLNHALFKSCLFLLVGILTLKYKSRDIRYYGTFNVNNINIFILFIISSLSMAGIPPLCGFYGKEYFYNLSINFGYLINCCYTFFIPFFCVLSGILTFSYSFRLIYDLYFIKIINQFLKQDKKNNNNISEALGLYNNIIYIPSLILCFIIILFGIKHNKLILFFNNIIFQCYHSCIFRLSNHYLINLNLENILTILTIVFGIIIYNLKVICLKNNILKNYLNINLLNYFYILSPNYIYNTFINNIFINSKKYIKTIQNGNLKYYLSFIITIYLVSLLYPILHPYKLLIIFNIYIIEYLLCFFLILIFYLLLFIVLSSISIFSLTIFSSLIGIFITLLFTILKAPDLSMTQICIESILSYLIFLLLSKYTYNFIINMKINLHDYKFYNINNSLYNGFLLSVTSGIVLFYYTSNLQLEAPFSLSSNYFISNYKLLSSGLNFVNIIVTNFRGYDTFGEVIILFIATIFIYNILQNINKKDK